MTDKASVLAAALERATAAERSGSWDEALAAYEAGLSRLPREGSAAAAAELMRRIGRVHRERGDVELAVEALEASLAMAEASGLRGQVAQALNSLGGVRQLQGELEEAEPLYRRAQEIAESLGEERLAAMAEQNLGILSNMRGDLDGALGQYGSALRRHRSLGDDLTASRTLTNMGVLHLYREQWAEAQSCFDEALELASRVGDAAMVGSVEMNRAELYLRRQWYEQARTTCDRALAIFRQIRSRRWVAQAYKFYGILYRETGKAELADVHFGLTLGLAEGVQDRFLEAETLSEWAVAHVQAGQHREALQRLNRAHRIFTRLEARHEIWQIEQRLEELRSTYLAAARTWGAESVEARDRCRSGEGGRIACYSQALAAAAGLGEWDLTWISTGAYVRDIGLTVVPAEVFRKAGGLTPQDSELIRSHTVIGDAIAAEMEFPDPVRSIVRSHHERWDGTGYPDRKGGEEIPLPARILSIASGFDALTSPLRLMARSSEEALKVLAAESGRAFDPDLLGIFGSLVEGGGIAIAG